MARLNVYRPWFYAAAVYNAVWGGVVILFPNLIFTTLGMTQPNYPGLCWNAPSGLPEGWLA